MKECDKKEKERFRFSFKDVFWDGPDLHPLGLRRGDNMEEAANKINTALEYILKRTKI